MKLFYCLTRTCCVFIALVLSQIFFSPILSAQENYKYNVAIAAIFQNEAPYLREWIEFHKLVGVQHFYLYNNLSNDNFNEVLAPYVKSGVVDLIEWEYNTNPDGGNWPTIQAMAYDNVLGLTRNVVKWLVVIDIDEFIFPVGTDKLTNFLSNFEDVAAVCVNWQMYGTSDVKKITSKQLMIEKLTYKAETDYPENVHVKSIVRPEFVERTATPHHFIFLPGYYQVNANKERFDGPYNPVLIDKIRINHYWTRDKHFFENVKLPRRHKWQDDGCIERANNLNKIKDKAIFKYIPKLKKAMGLKKKEITQLDRDQ